MSGYNKCLTAQLIYDNIGEEGERRRQKTKGKRVGIVKSEKRKAKNEKQNRATVGLVICPEYSGRNRVCG